VTTTRQLRARTLLAIAGLAAAWLSGCGADSPAQNVTGSSEQATRLYMASHSASGGYLEGVVKVFEVASGDTRAVEVPELGGDATHWIVPRGDRLVYWAGGDAVYSTDLELEGPPLKLGEASPWLTFIPSAEPDRVWLIEHGGDSIESVREVTTKGRVTVPAVRPWQGRWPDSAVNQGLVFPTENGTTVWSPTSGETILELPPGNMIAAHGDLVASCSFPADGFRITDVASGEERWIGSPAELGRFECGPGAFSPDGRHLIVTILPTGFEPAAEVRFALVDVEGDAAKVVSGATVGGSPEGHGYLDIAWAPTSDAVYIGNGNGGSLHIPGGVLEYRIGEERAAPLPVGDNDFVRMAAG